MWRSPITLMVRITVFSSQLPERFLLVISVALGLSLLWDDTWSWCWEELCWISLAVSLYIDLNLVILGIGFVGSFFDAKENFFLICASLVLRWLSWAKSTLVNDPFFELFSVPILDCDSNLSILENSISPLFILWIRSGGAGAIEYETQTLLAC